MVENEMTSGSVVQNEAVLLQDTDDLAWLYAGSFGMYTLISIKNQIKLVVTVGLRRSGKLNQLVFCQWLP